MIKRTLILLLCAVSFFGCVKNNNTCTFNSCAVVAPQSEIQAVQAYLSANNITTAIQHCSGLYYEIITPGTGKSVDACGSVNTTYVGKLTNGSQFDANTASFGLGDVILGWQIGVPLIKEGGKIRLYVPPTLGYGNRAAGTIPPNSILIFDITLNTVY
jgi:FKBP-type peptidyl-prolyl cis-trans isomerase FkpA